MGKLTLLGCELEKLFFCPWALIFSVPIPEKRLCVEYLREIDYPSPCYGISRKRTCKNLMPPQMKKSNHVRTDCSGNRRYSVKKTWKWVHLLKKEGWDRCWLSTCHVLTFAFRLKEYSTLNFTCKLFWARYRNVIYIIAKAPTSNSWLEACIYVNNSRVYLFFKFHVMSRYEPSLSTVEHIADITPLAGRNIFNRRSC